MLEYGAYEAKTHFSQLLDRVEAGETVLIKRHGKVIAELTAPTLPKKRKSPTPLTDQMRVLRQQIKQSQTKPFTIEEIVKMVRKDRNSH